MARVLDTDLDQLQLAERRRPGYRLEVFDIRSTSTEVTPTRINDVVVFNLGLGLLPAIVGPREFEDDVIQVDVTEVAGDYVNQGIAATHITFQVSDPDGLLDPVGNPAPANGRWLRQGNVVVVREGDEEVDVSDWPITFTGAIQGQPGQERGRNTGLSVLAVKCSSREVDFLRRKNTTRNFLQGTAFQDIGEEIAETDMGLGLDELNLGSFGGGRLTCHLSTQFVDESPLATLAKLMFPEGFMPRFEGDGRLGITTGVTSKAATRIYDESELPITITRPILEFNGTNDVEIIGLDCDLTKIVQERQLLATAGITTGFFSKDSKIEVIYSEDGTQQAEDLTFLVVQSVGDSPITFGSEDFTPTIQSDGGSIRGDIDVDGSIGSGILLVGLIVGAWIASLGIPDFATEAPGPVLPTGRSFTVFAGKAIMFVLAQNGRGEYEIHGRPYEYVFKEIRAVARISGIRSEDREQVSIENHLIGSQADADEIALRVLRRERTKQNLRGIFTIHDLRLEPDDVLQVGSGTGSRRYMINSISRTLSRDGDGTAALGCFEVTSGVRP